MGGDGGGWGAPLEAGPYGSGLYLWAGWQGSFRKMLDGSLFVPQSRERSTQHTMPTQTTYTMKNKPSEKLYFNSEAFDLLNLDASEAARILSEAKKMMIESEKSETSVKTEIFEQECIKKLNEAKNRLKVLMFNIDKVITLGNS